MSLPGKTAGASRVGAQGSPPDALFGYYPHCGNVAGWLQGLGLERYDAVFRENEIDEAILPNLTAENLKELGITALGHRLKLLDAIADLRTEAGVIAPVADAVLRAPSVCPEDHAERRQLTVMFSDLVGSTALSARMDPEDLREVIAAYQKCVAETVRPFGGFVAQYMGDGVIVYFGYPLAQEDDAERAVSAGLELVAAVSNLKTNAALQARVGIATGLVVIGDLFGSGAAQEQAVVGETPNLAARLQGIAEPDAVIIAENTRRLLGNLFELEDRGPQDLKGIAGPVRAWAALRTSAVESRFEALHADSLTQLVGREEELDLLLRRWSRAKTGEGQVVLISGEPGIGKSRLTAALLERLAAEPHAQLRYFCSPQHTHSAFYPIIRQMERAARLAPDDTSQAKLDKLDALLAETSTSIQDATLFADMLSLPNDGRYPTLDLNSEQRRQRTFEALITQMKALSRSSPVLMIVEDAHWTDPTSIEVLDRMADLVRRLDVLIIVTFRPEFEPPWIGRPHVTFLVINRLGERESATMIDCMVGNKPLPANIRQGIIQRTDGIPLFVEEITKAVLEEENQGAAEHLAADPTFAVPASLHASLMARLDRLGPAKEIAQIGAAIGREFSHALLAAVARQPEAETNTSLDRLVAARLLFRQGVPPHASYLFKHALLQDAAYGTLVRESRRALHARIAETIEGRFAEIAENQPELLARHYTEAGLIEKAASLWGKAGQRSLERSALVESAEQLTRALDQIATLPATPTLRRRQIKLQVALITPLIHVKGYVAPETKAAVERARLLIDQAGALGELPDDPLLLFSVLHASFIANIVAFNGDVARQLAGQFLALAQKQASTALRLVAHRDMGISLLYTAEIPEAREHFNQGIAHYDPADRHKLATRFTVSPGVVIWSHRSLALWVLGYPQAALADAEHALKEAREIGQAASLMLALLYASWTYTQCGEYAAANALLDELIALADEKTSSTWKGRAILSKGCQFVLTGKALDAVQIINSGIAAHRSTGATFCMPWYFSYLARAYADLGHFDDAWRCIGEGTRAVETTKERWCEAEICRTAGEIALLSGREAAKAEAHFERALTVARQHQAKSWEIHAAMSMARLWRDQGKPTQARELLVPVYGWFTEGFDTRDLKEAKALLEELSSAR
jgi:predicted ATPase/class 3 adenylate cyclase